MGHHLSKNSLGSVPRKSNTTTTNPKNRYSNTSFSSSSISTNNNHSSGINNVLSTISIRKSFKNSLKNRESSNKIPIPSLNRTINLQIEETSIVADNQPRSSQTIQQQQHQQGQQLSYTSSSASGGSLTSINNPNCPRQIIIKIQLAKMENDDEQQQNRTIQEIDTNQNQLETRTTTTTTNPNAAQQILNVTLDRNRTAGSSSIHNNNNNNNIDDCSVEYCEILNEETTADAGECAVVDACLDDNDKEYNQCCRRKSKKSSSYISTRRCCKCTCRDAFRRIKESTTTTAAAAAAATSSSKLSSAAGKTTKETKEQKHSNKFIKTTKSSSFNNNIASTSSKQNNNNPSASAVIATTAPLTSKQSKQTTMAVATPPVTASVATVSSTSGTNISTPISITNGGMGATASVPSNSAAVGGTSSNLFATVSSQVSIWSHLNHVNEGFNPGFNPFFNSPLLVVQCPPISLTLEQIDNDGGLRLVSAAGTATDIHTTNGNSDTTVCNVSRSVNGPIVHSQVDFVHHLVPDLDKIFNLPFYWCKMDRYEAESLLEGKPEGTFLLRDSAQEEFLFSVTFRKYGRSLHARIEQSGQKFSFDCHDPAVFTATTVTGLLEHYKDPTCVMFFEPMLTHPLHRKAPFSLQELCRAKIVANTTYNGINQMELPTPLKSYLKKYHYKQKLRVKPLDEPYYYECI